MINPAVTPRQRTRAVGAALHALLSGVEGKISRVFALDLRSLAAFRIGLALLIIADLARRSTDLVAHYTDQGILPRAALADTRLSERLSLHLLTGSWEGEAALFAMAAAIAVLLLVGYQTRLVTIVSLVLLISLHNRNPLVLSGADTLLRVILFWAIFLPCGARWSVDSIRRRPGARVPVTVSNIATMAFVLQVAFLYLFAALLKSGNDWRSDGTAVYYALSLGQLSTPLGEALLRYPDLLTVMTRGILAVELLGPLLLIAPIWTSRLRLVGIVLLGLLHLGFGLLLANLGLFPYIDFLALIALIPSVCWDRWATRLAGVSRPGRHHVTGRALPCPALAASSWVARVRGLRPRIASSWRIGGTPTAPDRVGQLSPLLTVMASCALVHITLANLSTLPGSPYHMPWLLGGVGRFIGLNQGWTMFAPNVLKDSTWYVARGTLSNGRQVDVYNNRDEVVFDRPPSIAETYPNDHWFRYLESFGNAEMESKRPYFGAYLCRQWNAVHAEADHVEQVEVIALRQRVLLDDRGLGPRQDVILVYPCQG